MRRTTTTKTKRTGPTRRRRSLAKRRQRSKCLAIIYLCLGPDQSFKLRGPFLEILWALFPSYWSSPLSLKSSYSSFVNSVKPQFLDSTMAWRPGILNLARLSASFT
eukprot:XP_001706047.1 Hypothetical protein GL50803_32002 [Giardia lamblia ATCC 50803]